MAKHTVDEFDVQARLLSDKCKERLQQSGSNKPNFGDSRWVECKRSITTNGIINNLRIRRKFGQQFIKLTSRGATVRNDVLNNEKFLLLSSKCDSRLYDLIVDLCCNIYRCYYHYLLITT